MPITVRGVGGACVNNEINALINISGSFGNNNNNITLFMFVVATNIIIIDVMLPTLSASSASACLDFE